MSVLRGAVSDKFVFMDDNATCHRTLTVQDCMDSEGIQRLVWPARLSRFKAIENVMGCFRDFSAELLVETIIRQTRTPFIRRTHRNGINSQQLLDNVVQTTGTTVSRQTVYRRLGHISLYARRPVRCVALTATHCHLRLTWSREHALWTPQQWSCVMFSDESRFSLQSDSRRTLIWRAPGTRYHQENKHH
ncbi:transposable element Tcb1 transposase [Trichonephila clavipes]|nr:transposable element Tcb1 transposase [Trichonephila clavipes]